MRSRAPRVRFIQTAAVAALLAITTALPPLFSNNSQGAAADEIFQWTDEEGRVHFTTEKLPSATSKTLPKIGRDNIENRIKQIKQFTPITCDKHGGNDCSQGADADGSVICLDGFRGSIAPFQFQCREAKLQVEYRVLTTQGVILHSRHLSALNAINQALGLQVSIRNLSGIEAYGLKAEFVFSRRNRIKALGPEKIPPYGNVDLTAYFSELPEQPTQTQLEQSTYSVDCTNCGIVRGTTQ